MKIISSFLLSVTCFMLLACASQAPRTSPFLILTTDFGMKDGAVSAMKGVAFTASPQLVVSDLTHEIPPYNIWEAAYRLQQTYSFWPPGSVFVTVVDPGVGSQRKPIVAKTKGGHYFVGPDNGHLSLLAHEITEVRWINESTQRREGSEQSYTFHGRDLFVLVGARLASGQLAFDQVGPVAGQSIILLNVEQPKMVNGELRGQIPVLDPNYGNVWTNISKTELLKHFPEAKSYRVVINQGPRVLFEGHLPLAETFSAVPKGRPLLYFNSLLNVSLALNQGSFAAKHRIGSGPDWVIRLRPR